MRQSHGDKGVGPITEMAIVNTFTKLIFGDEGFTDRESGIIEALRSVSPDVLHDTHHGIGEYLRGLGVREMIQLVSRVRQHTAEHGSAPVLPADRPAPGIQTRLADRTRSDR